MGRTQRRDADRPSRALGGRRKSGKRSMPTSSFFPSRYLGELVRRESAAADARRASLSSKLYDADDIFPLVRREARQIWGGRADGDCRWASSDCRLARDGRRESIEHWPAIMLLARAAGCASHPQQEAVLFDPQTMTPRIAEPPFVRALGGMAGGSESATEPTPERRTSRSRGRITGVDRCSIDRPASGSRLRAGLARCRCWPAAIAGCDSRVAKRGQRVRPGRLAGERGHQPGSSVRSARAHCRCDDRNWARAAAGSTRPAGAPNSAQSCASVLQTALSRRRSARGAANSGYGRVSGRVGRSGRESACAARRPPQRRWPKRPREWDADHRSTRPRRPAAGVSERPRHRRSRKRLAGKGLPAGRLSNAGCDR